jgi:Na+-transporting NADH:ubiquinone oxidoreductase subunit F
VVSCSPLHSWFDGGGGGIRNPVGLALSSPLPEDDWTGHSGFIHEVVQQEYLSEHANPNGIEYYLCGPPMMIKACTRMLGVSSHQIAYDES